jgi:hypothetical protein
MVQQNINVSPESFGRFMDLKAKKATDGDGMSNARLIDYLVEFHNSVWAAFCQAVEMQKPSDGYEVLKNAVSAGFGYRPPVIPRGGYKPSRNASIQTRILVTQQIITRLGIDNPPRELVNYYLDNGFDGSGIRAQVLKDKDLQAQPPSDTPAQP